MTAQEAYNYDALLSRAHFVGKDTSDPRMTGRQVFTDSNNHPTAVASILVFIASNLGFKPQDGAITDPQIFAQFENRLSKTSALQRVKSDSYILALTGDPTQLACEVSKKVDRVNAYKVAESFRRMVLASVKGVWWRDFLLTQVVLHKAADSDNITVEVASLGLTLSQNSDGRAVINRQTAVLSQKLFKVNAEDLITKDQHWEDAVIIFNVGDYLLKLTSEGDSTSTFSSSSPSFSFSSFADEDIDSLCSPLFSKLPEIEFPDISTPIRAFFAAIAGFFAGIGEAIGIFFKAISNFFAGIGPAIGDFFTNVGNFFVTVWEHIASIPAAMGCVAWVVVYVLVGALAGAAAALASTVFVLLCLGFGPIGIIAGSIAALWMSSYLGFVPAGSLLSFLQSAGTFGLMAFFPVNVIIGIIVGGGYGGYLAVVRDQVCDAGYAFM